MTNILDARTTIIEELQSLNVRSKLTGDTFFIVCPFHDGDSTPSFGVHIGQGGRVPLGAFNCFGCEARGRNWNDFAKRTNLKQLKDWQKFVGSTNNDLLDATGGMLTIDKSINADTQYTVEKLMKIAGNSEAIPWPKNKPWRGYPGKLITKMGGLYYNDWGSDELQLLFPVLVNGKLRGGVKAQLEKPKYGLSYVATAGKWVKSYGLFGYDAAVRIIQRKKYTFIILVEGPRDCLRLLKAGIPAVAILGSQNFSDKKLTLILGMMDECKCLYVLPDNDVAGRGMAKLIKGVASKYVKVKYLKLPREVDKKGKLIKMDPDNMPKSILREIKDKVKASN
jgi:5S rRNA maturation endonuclease (ribonuclease M5)